jgi:hypothetical protein
MRIYIDEAGPFIVPVSRPHSISLVLALVIPTATEANLFTAFLNVRNRWTRGEEIEVKGRCVDELQAAKIIDLLSRYDVLVEFYAVDMTRETDPVLNRFKAQQALKITANLTAEHHPQVVQQLRTLANSVSKLPNQLFIQAFTTLELIYTSIRSATLYFAQRRPEELGNIEWIVDRKDRSMTAMEESWSTLILPMGEFRFAKKPLGKLAGADYSHFSARYEIPESDKNLARHVNWMRNIYGIKNDCGVLYAKRLLSEQLSFHDSRDSLGLQLADILASTLRRAFNQQLKFPGWKEFGRLLVRRDYGHSRFISFGRRDARLTGHVLHVWRQLDACSKSMIV